MLPNKHHFCNNWSEALSSAVFVDVRKLLLGQCAYFDQGSLMACLNLFEICSYESGGFRTERHLDQLKDCIVE